MRSTYAGRDERTSIELQQRQLDAFAAESRPAVRLEQQLGGAKESANVSSLQSQAKPSAVRRPAAEPRSGFAGDVEVLAGLLPAPAPLEPRPGGSIVDSVAAILVMALVASLLLGMLTLVTRFVRGSWNP